MTVTSWLTLLIALFTAACTPVVIPAGPPTTAPALLADTLVMPDGARLPLVAWLPEGPPRAVLLAVHGLNDRAANFMAESGPELAAAGLAVYAYDQRGFGGAPHPGLWSGTASLVADAREAARLIRARHPGLNLALLGESLGAGVVVLAATAPGPPVADRIILSAPSLWGRAAMPGVMRGGLWLAERLIPRVGFPGTAGGIAASDNQEALLRWGRDPLTLKITRVDLLSGVVDMMDQVVGAVPGCCGVPTLVLVGAQDKVVPPAIARRALRTLPQEGPAAPRVAYYPAGWHLLLRDLQRDVVARDILAWIADSAGPLPSGADTAARAWIAN